jgi:RNA-directed DNA polymerase
MTRYADDITISSDLDLPKDIISTVEKVYAPLHLRFSPKKTKFMRKHKRQKVTGLIVNEKVALPKEARRKLRAFFHHADTVGLIPALQKTTIVRGEGSMLDPFLGYLSFLHMIDPVQAAVYLNEIHKLTGSNK